MENEIELAESAVNDTIRSTLINAKQRVYSAVNP
jgi:hypothetical protein